MADAKMAEIGSKFYEHGFYWVRLHGQWLVAEGEAGKFYLPGHTHTYTASDFHEIGERIEAPINA